MLCLVKAKIHYTSFPVASRQHKWQVRNKFVTSWCRQKSVVSVVSCWCTPRPHWQLTCPRGSYGETCVMDFGHYRINSSCKLSPIYPYNCCNKRLSFCAPISDNVHSSELLPTFWGTSCNCTRMYFSIQICIYDVFLHSVRMNISRWYKAAGCSHKCSTVLQ